MSRLSILQGARPKRVDTLIGAGDSELPANWPVYNAPRPLLGELAWKGTSCHGVYYAAMNPADPRTPEYALHNERQDAWLVEWTSEEEARAWLKSAGKFPPERVDAADAHTVWVSYIRQRGAGASNRAGERG